MEKMSCKHCACVKGMKGASKGKDKETKSMMSKRRKAVERKKK